MDLRRLGKGPEAELCLKRKVLFQYYVSFAHFQAVVCCFKRCVFLDQLWFLLWPTPPPRRVTLKPDATGIFMGRGGGSCCRRPIND